jgi:hypothetical protein
MTQRLQITNCKTSRIGEIVVMKEITDINTINSPPTNHGNRPPETQAPASSGHPLELSPKVTEKHSH